MNKESLEVDQVELRFRLQLLEVCIWELRLVPTNYLPNS